eukprot:7505715-Pyramimonas_sp.AAC.1
MGPQAEAEATEAEAAEGQATAANTIEAKTDETKRKVGGRDTTTLGHVWEAASLMEGGGSLDTETPDYISADAAYQ